MDDLLAFIAARLDEDEAAAEAATPGPWTVEGSAMPYIAERITSDGGRIRVISGTRYEGESPAIGKVADAVHVARHDPARVLREVSAKRAILAEYERVAGSAKAYPNSATITSLGAAQTMLRALGCVWGDHADYRQDWAA